MSSILTTTWRLILIGSLATSLSYRPLSAALEHPSTRHLWVIPAWVVLIALGQQRRGIRERLVHDRQTDGIIAAGLIGLSGIIYWAIAPRLGIDATQFWIELPLVVLFTMGWCVALFGTRPVLRYRRVWLFALVFGWPLTYRMIIDVTATFGASELAGLVSIAAIASATAIDRPVRHSMLAAILTVVIAIVGVLTYASPSITRDLTISALAPILACLPWLAGSLRELVRSSPERKLVVRRPRLAEVLAIALAAVLWTGLGAMQDPTVIRLNSALLPAAIEPGPRGWELLTSIDVPSAAIVFGDDAVWTRTYWRAEESNSAAHGRDQVPRRIVIDDVRVAHGDPLILMPFPAQYELTPWSRSAVVVLDTGVPFRSALMAATLERTTDVTLGATFISVDLTIADGSGQRLTVVAVDDHRATAPFPVPGHGFRTHTWSTVQRLLRGDEAASLELERAKDTELLESVIAGLLPDLGPAK